MTAGRRRLYASALGVASALVSLLFNARRLFGFARSQVLSWSHSGNFGHIFLLGREYVLEDWLTVGLYDVLFKGVPVFTQGIFLVWAFGAWSRRRDARLREMIPVYLLVMGFTAVSDCCNIFAPNCYGEAAVFTALRDALYFLVFLVHRFAPLVFFCWIWRKGTARTTPAIWCVAASHGLCVAGLAILRIVLFPMANHTDTCTHLVFGAALSVACFMAAHRSRTPEAEICYNTERKVL